MHAEGDNLKEARLDVPAGLAGVRVAETTIGSVRGQEGYYHYREHNATDLARERTVEEVWHLLLRGHLPSVDELASFSLRIEDARHPGESTLQALPAIAAASQKAAPLADLRTALSLHGAELGIGASLDVDAGTLEDQTIRLVAAMPALVVGLAKPESTSAAARATSLRPSGGTPEVHAGPVATGTAATYLRMLTGSEPSPEHVAALDRYLVSTIDHGFNASTFATRVVVSTGADACAALLAGLGALSGPLHGGAPSRALDMLDEIGTADRAAEWAREAVSAGHKIMGFGHRVYRTRDPRAVLMRETALSLGGPRVDLAIAVEEAVVSVLAELKPGRDLYANVEFYAAVVMDAVGIPRGLFTATFALSRAIGWSAHILEQHAEGRLIRPSAAYVGPEPTVPDAGDAN